MRLHLYLRISSKFSAELSYRESICVDAHQKTEEGAKEDGQKAQSQPAAEKQKRHGNFHFQMKTAPI